MQQLEESGQQCTSTAVSTELTSADIDYMQRECKFNEDKVVKLTADLEVLQQKLSMMSSVLGRIGKDDKQVHFYTGLPSYAVFEALFHHLSPLVSKHMRLMFGMGLRSIGLMIGMRLRSIGLMI